MTTIRQANINYDSFFITEIWKACFTEDTEYIDFLIDHCLCYSTTWLLERDGMAVSVLTMIPCYFTHQETSSLYTGGYIYGVGTLPEHRGLSFSGMLLQNAISHAKNKNLDYLIVKPASSSLYPVYKRVGFKTVLYENEWQKKITEIVKPNSDFANISPEELFSLRKNRHIFLWPLDILVYAAKEIVMRKGVIAAKEGLYYCAYPLEHKPDTICILETNAENHHEINNIISSIKYRYPPAKSILIKGSFLSLKQGRSGLLYPIRSKGLQFNPAPRISLPME